MRICWHGSEQIESTATTPLTMRTSTIWRLEGSQNDTKSTGCWRPTSRGWQDGRIALGCCFYTRDMTKSLESHVCGNMQRRGPDFKKHDELAQARLCSGGKMMGCDPRPHVQTCMYRIMHSRQPVPGPGRNPAFRNRVWYGAVCRTPSASRKAVGVEYTTNHMRRVRNSYPESSARPRSDP